MTKKGVSLIEFLVALSVLTIISGVLVAIFTSGWRVFSQQSALIETQDQANLVTSTITKEVQQANKVVGTKTITGNSYTSSSAVLILELASIDVKNYIIEGSFDYEVFYLDPADPHKLKMTIEAAGASIRKSETKTLANLVDSFELTYYSPDEEIENTNRIAISTSTAQTSYGRTQQTSLTAFAKLRNK